MTTPTMQFREERVDDIPLLLGFLQKMNLPALLEEQLGSHHLHQGLSNGWLATVWIAFLLSEANPCKVSVQDWAQAHHHLLATLPGEPLRDVEFSDDRLSIILRRFHDADWKVLETALWNGTCQVYQIPLEVIRLDSTTSHAYHEVTAEGLLPYGHSKDHRPDLPQFKLMAAAAQPTSQMMACNIVPGHEADDPLYGPLIERVRTMVGRRGLLYAGDCKMAALDTRGDIMAHGDSYRTPLPRTGETAKQWDAWIDAALHGQQPLQALRRENEAGAEEVFAHGYEFVRECATTTDKQRVGWSERVQVVRSLGLAERQTKHLENQLRQAEEALQRLTPPPGRGIHPYRDEAVLHEATTAILEHYGVQELLEVAYVCEAEAQTCASRSGGEKSRKVRYRIADVKRA